MSLEYIVREPKTNIENPSLLVLLHGYGSNENDLFSFAEALPQELIIVSARAPYEMGYGGYAWYAINFDANNAKFSDIKQANTSITIIADFIAEMQKKYTITKGKTFLLGFSQGAILSYAYSLKHPNKVQHVIALSGYINSELLPEKVSSEINTDYYISHGTMDQVLPVTWGNKAPQILSGYNLKAEYHEYPIGHGVSPQNFYSFKSWIENRLE